MTNLCVEHPEDLAALIVDDALRLLVVQHGDGETALIVRLRLEVHLPYVREVAMALERVRHDVLTRLVLILCDKAPALASQVPVDCGEGDDVLETLQLAGNERAMGLRCQKRKQDRDSHAYPWAGVADVEMIPSRLWGISCAGLSGDGIAERADLALELARLVVGMHPIGDLALGGLSERVQRFLERTRTN